LQDRSAEKGGALVVKLARAPGAREQRWAHLLCGPVDESLWATGGDGRLGANPSGLSARVDLLEAELAQLKATVGLLCSELGVQSPGGLEAAPANR
jgi:uncharacterized protein YceH (UPF0502 family)